jgi:uncharacterized membrane protein YidH (DUF202 family)
MIMRTIGVVLLILGIVALIYGGISYSRNRTILELGSLEITATERKNVPIPAIVGVVVLIGGAAILFAGSRRSGRA